MPLRISLSALLILGSVLEPLMGQPLPKITIRVNAFIPKDIEDVPSHSPTGKLTEPVPKDPSKTMVRGPKMLPPGAGDYKRCFLTDQRDFDFSGVTSRIKSTTTLDLLNPGPPASQAQSDPTVEIDCSTAAEVCNKKETPTSRIDDFAVVKSPNGHVKSATFSVTAQGSNPCVAAASLGPIVIAAKFRIDLVPSGESGTISVDALHKAFPAYEIQVVPGSLSPISLMKEPPVIGFDPGDLLLPPNRTFKDSRYFGPPVVGKWQSQDPQHRFAIEINDATSTVTEGSTTGAKLTRLCSIEFKEGFLLSSRQNDDSVLAFLAIKPSVRQWMLAQGVQPSYMRLYFQNGQLTGEWHGVTVTLNPNGTPKQLIQPSQNPGKIFTFGRLP